jgi:uncharacterized protein YbjT (DUF2867 family)
MRILVLGASGLIGSAVAARLVGEGHEVVAVSRRRQSASLARMSWLALDLARVRDPADWRIHLQDIDAVVNCAGLLQDMPGQSVEAVQAKGAAVLFRACAQSGVRRVIHLSAIGADRATTAFSRSKLAGDQALMALDLDWIILRPSVVIGRGAYGGSALLRGLASLPALPVMPDTAQLQIVHLDDVVDAIAFFLRPDAPARQVVELVGPRRYRFEEVVALLRRWMRWPPARTFQLPPALAAVIYRAGDFAALLGWVSPIRTTAQREMTRGAVGDASRLTALTGIVPRDVEQALAREPASVQERWFARLYLLKPVLFVTFALFWLATGLISLGPARGRGIELVMSGGASRTVALLATLAGGCADLVIGIAIAFRATARAGLLAALAISVVYTIIGTILVPHLWIDPLGPMLKIPPIMVLNLVALAILEDR